MPTILRSGPYRFLFYSGYRNEPPHVHIVEENQRHLLESGNEYIHG